MDTWAHTLDLNTVHLLCAMSQWYWPIFHVFALILTSAPHPSTSLFLSSNFFFLYIFLLFYDKLQTLLRYGRFLWHIFCCSPIFILQTHGADNCDNNHGQTSILTQWIGNSVRFKFVPSPSLQLFQSIPFCVSSLFAFVRFSFLARKNVYPATLLAVALFSSLCSITKMEWIFDKVLQVNWIV